MTTTTRNEIAEQVLAAVQIGLSVDWRASLYAVAAAERRATVERIRERLLLDEGEPVPESYASRVLDEEAARV